MLVTVQYKLIMLKTMEDGGIVVAGPLISTSNTILDSMASCSLLVLGIIPGGLR